MHTVYAWADTIKIEDDSRVEFETCVVSNVDDVRTATCSQLATKPPVISW